eukprot:2525259-Rhodomonas_salina.2
MVPHRSSIATPAELRTVVAKPRDHIPRLDVGPNGLAVGHLLELLDEKDEVEKARGRAEDDTNLALGLGPDLVARELREAVRGDRGNAQLDEEAEAGETEEKKEELGTERYEEKSCLEITLHDADRRSHAFVVQQPGARLIRRHQLHEVLVAEPRDRHHVLVATLHVVARAHPGVLALSAQLRILAHLLLRLLGVVFQAPRARQRLSVPRAPPSADDAAVAEVGADMLTHVGLIHLDQRELLQKLLDKVHHARLLEAVHNENGHRLHLCHRAVHTLPLLNNGLHSVQEQLHQQPVPSHMRLHLAAGTPCSTCVLRRPKELEVGDVDLHERVAGTLPGSSGTLSLRPCGLRRAAAAGAVAAQVTDVLPPVLHDHATAAAGDAHELQAAVKDLAYAQLTASVDAERPPSALVRDLREQHARNEAVGQHDRLPDHEGYLQAPVPHQAQLFPHHAHRFRNHLCIELPQDPSLPGGFKRNVNDNDTAGAFDRAHHDAAVARNAERAEVFWLPVHHACFQQLQVLLVNHAPLPPVHITHAHPRHLPSISHALPLGDVSQAIVGDAQAHHALGISRRPPALL